jgi:hypothetical protein
VADEVVAPSASATEADDDALLARLEGDVTTIQQQAPQPSQLHVTEPPPPEVPTEPWWSARSAISMCSIILVFGLIVIGISSSLALKRIDKETILKVVVIPMAVMLAVFLVVAGYSDSQIAPAMGLLGTIVGYVLGARGKGATDEGGPA